MKCSENEAGMSKRHTRQTKGVATRQIWNQRNIKTIVNYNPGNKTGIYMSLLTKTESRIRNRMFKSQSTSAQNIY